MFRFLPQWLRDWTDPHIPLATVARDFAQVGNDDHADLQRIGHGPMVKAEKPVVEQPRQKVTNIRSGR